MVSARRLRYLVDGLNAMDYHMPSAARMVCVTSPQWTRFKVSVNVYVTVRLRMRVAQASTVAPPSEPEAVDTHQH